MFSNIPTNILKCPFVILNNEIILQQIKKVKKSV